MHDIVIIGGGPAGMTAALYALRAGRTVLLLEKNAFGGQIAFSPKVENFPGTASMSGSDFADRLLSQVLDLGAQVDVAEAKSILTEEGHRCVLCADGERHRGRALILATGARHRVLNVPGERELTGSGVCYCAVCDGDFYRGRRVAMAGGGNTALQEALHLADLCREVTVIQNLPAFTGEERLSRALMARHNVRVLFRAQVTRCVEENGELREVRVQIEGQDDETPVPVEGLFVAIGLEPENEDFADVVHLDPYGYIVSDERCLSSTPGIFVAGDCRTKDIRQLTTAVSDGTVAATAACRYLS